MHLLCVIDMSFMQPDFRWQPSRRLLQTARRRPDSRGCPLSHWHHHPVQYVWHTPVNARIPQVHVALHQTWMAMSRCHEQAGKTEYF